MRQAFRQRTEGEFFRGAAIAELDRHPGGRPAFQHIRQSRLNKIVDASQIWFRGGKHADQDSCECKQTANEVTPQAAGRRHPGNATRLEIRPASEIADALANGELAT
jgi:hypothetical protein